jgi:hypothetical protein
VQAQYRRCAVVPNVTGLATIPPWRTTTLLVVTALEMLGAVHPFGCVSWTQKQATDYGGLVSLAVRVWALLRRASSHELRRIPFVEDKKIPER